MNTKNSFPILVVLMLLVINACSSVKVKNTRIVSVAGSLSAGADWSETLSDKTGEMTLDEFIEFLEPQEANPETGEPERAGAICQSAADWNEIKTELETACTLLGKRCTYEMQRTIKLFSKALTRLQKKSLNKMKGQRGWIRQSIKIEELRNAQAACTQQHLN